MQNGKSPGLSGWTRELVDDLNRSRVSFCSHNYLFERSRLCLSACNILVDVDSETGSFASTWWIAFVDLTRGSKPKRKQTGSDIRKKENDFPVSCGIKFPPEIA